MDQPQIKFDDGAAYERMMGTWSRLDRRDISRLAGATARRLRWVDVGCGNGAFTELLVDALRAVVESHGIDPSEGQLTFARKRPARMHREVQAGRRDGAALSPTRASTSRSWRW